MSNKVQEVLDAITALEVEIEVMRQCLFEYTSEDDLIKAPQADVSDMFAVWKSTDKAWTELSVAKKLLKRTVGHREPKPLAGER